MKAVYKNASPYLAEAGFRIDKQGDAAWKVFFVVAPDGLSYCLGEKLS